MHLAGAYDGLLPDDPISFYNLYFQVGILDLPIAGKELNVKGAVILYFNNIGKCKIVMQWPR